MTDTTETPEERIRWKYTVIGQDYIGLVNDGLDPALDVEVDFVIRWRGERDSASETRRADLVPPGQGVWHNATPMPQGTNPSVPREVMWEVRWKHPYYGEASQRRDVPIDIHDTGSEF